MSILIISFLNYVIFAIYCYFVSCVVLNRTVTDIKRIVIAFIPFMIMYYGILCLYDSIYSIFFSGLFAFYFIKTIFKEKLFMSLFLSLILHTVKYVIKVLLLFIYDRSDLLLINTYKTLSYEVFFINLFTLIVAMFMIFIFRKHIRMFVKHISSLNRREIVLLIFVYVDFIFITFIQPPNNISLLQMITDFSIIFTVTGMGIFNLSSEKKMDCLNNYYNDIFEYSKTNADLVYEYKTQVHENKNKLLMIRSMVDGPKNNLKKYVDELLREVNDNKKNYWLAELRHIPLPGVRNFINYKLVQLNELGAEIEVFVSSELANIDTSLFGDNEYNQLTTILGVILDNMIESIAETDEKLVSINLYLEDGKIHGEYVNSFSGKIDLSRLNEVGYTTKGEQHGVGLPLVARIVKNNNRFECTPKIIDNFFVQHFTIKLCNKNNLQKMTKK